MKFQIKFNNQFTLTRLQNFLNQIQSQKFNLTMLSKFSLGQQQQFASQRITKNKHSKAYRSRPLQSSKSPNMKVNKYGQKQKSNTIKSSSGNTQIDSKFNVCQFESQKGRNTNWQQSEMSSIHNMARKSSIRKLSKQRSDVTSYFPLRRYSQEADDQINQALIIKMQPRKKSSISKNFQKSMQRKSKSPEIVNGQIEKATRLKRSVLNGVQPNLLTNELRKYLNRNTTASKGQIHNCQIQLQKSPVVFKNQQSNIQGFNPDLPRTPTTAMRSSMVNISQYKLNDFKKTIPRNRTTSKSKQLKKMTSNKHPDHYQIQNANLQPRQHSRSRFRSRKPKSIKSLILLQKLQRKPGHRRGHSRSYSRVSFKSENGQHMSNRCLSINFPSKTNIMGRKMSTIATTSGQIAGIVQLHNAPRLEQLPLSPSRKSQKTKNIQKQKTRTIQRSNNKKRAKTAAIETSQLKLKFTTPTRANKRNINLKKVQNCQKLNLNQFKKACSAPPRKRKARAMSTTFGQRHLKTSIFGKEDAACKSISITGSMIKPINYKKRSKSASKILSKNTQRKAKSCGPVTKWMKLIASGTMKKSSRNLKLKKLEKANRKRRSESLKMRSKSMKKKRNKKLSEARRNIKARMNQQKQELLQNQIQSDQYQQPLDSQRGPLPIIEGHENSIKQPYQNMGGAEFNQLTSRNYQFGSRQSGADGLNPIAYNSSDTYYNDYQPGRLLENTSQNQQILSSSLRFDSQQHQFGQAQPIGAGPSRVRTDSSQRTLSVDNYQINEERASRNHSRQPGQFSRGQSGQFVRTADTINRKRHGSGSQGSSIRYSETLDNEIIANQMNGQLLTMPLQNFGQQESIPQEAFWQFKPNQIQNVKSEKSLMKKNSVSRSRSLKRRGSSKKYSRSSAVTARGSKSRQAASRTQSKQSIYNQNLTARKKFNRKYSRQSKSNKTRSHSNPSQRRSPNKSSQNSRLKSKQASSRFKAMNIQSAGNSMPQMIGPQYQQLGNEQWHQRGSLPNLRNSDSNHSQNKYSPNRFGNQQPDYIYGQAADQSGFDLTPMGTSGEVRREEWRTHSQNQSQQMNDQFEVNQYKRGLHSMNTSKQDIIQSMAASQMQYEQYRNTISQTEQRQNRIKNMGIDENKPLLEDKELREQLRELNYKQENRLAALREELKQNIKDIKQTKSQLIQSTKRDNKSEQEQSSDSLCALSKKKKPVAFIDKVNRYADRIDAMIEERFQREVTKIQDRRLKLQILKNRAEREAKIDQGPMEGVDLGSRNDSRHESREETIATERERQSLDIDELIRIKQDQIEGLQRQKLLNRLNMQPDSNIDFVIDRSNHQFQAPSESFAVNNQQINSNFVNQAEVNNSSVATELIKPRMTQSNVQFSGENLKHSARMSDHSSKKLKSASKKMRKQERVMESNSHRHSKRQPSNYSREKLFKQKHSRTSMKQSGGGSIDSAKVSVKSLKKKRSQSKKSVRGYRKRSESKKKQLTHDDIIYMKQTSSRKQSNRSRSQSRNMQSCQTEVNNSKNSTIVHQCKASVGSDRPTPELGTHDPYTDRHRSLIQNNHNQAYKYAHQNNPSLSIQDQAKKLRFSMDRGADSASMGNNINGVEVTSARGSAFASARSGMPFNIQTAQGMTGSGPGHAQTDPAIIYSNVIRINKDSGIFENFATNSIVNEKNQHYVNRKEGASKRKHHHNSILKNSSAKLANSQLSLERSCSHEEMTSQLASESPQYKRASYNEGPLSSHTDFGNVSIQIQKQQAPSVSHYNYQRQKVSSQRKYKEQPKENAERYRKLLKKASQSSQDDSSDSDSDLEFNYGRKAEFISKVRKAVRGRHGSKDKHLPKWQRLAINQIIV